MFCEKIYLNRRTYLVLVLYEYKIASRSTSVFNWMRFYGSRQLPKWWRKFPSTSNCSTCESWPNAPSTHQKEYGVNTSFIVDPLKWLTIWILENQMICANNVWTTMNWMLTKHAHRCRSNADESVYICHKLNYCITHEHSLFRCLAVNSVDRIRCTATTKNAVSEITRHYARTQMET